MVEPSWPRCQYVNWNGHRTCWKLAPFGRCLRHALRPLRWQHRSRWLTIDVDLGNMSLPTVSLDECRPRSYVSMSWGGDGSDPVWMVELHRPRDT